jgi:DNA polymerase V
MPVICLSNNDGCAIARSNEAKALEVKMGAPWTQIKQFAESEGLAALSANFALYGDISDRVMSLAAGLGHAQEIYSTDESFLNLDGIRGDLVEECRRICSRTLQWVVVPCGIGIGSTKTLAKLANHIAKIAERKPSVHPDHLAQVSNLAALFPTELEAAFEATEVDEVWGIGQLISKQLNDGGIKTVQDLVRMDPATIRHGWSVDLEHTVCELQGRQCIGLDDAREPRKEIACTRSFGHAVTARSGLTKAITEFAGRAPKKVHRQHTFAREVMVFINTSPFRNDPQFSRSIVVPLRRPSADTCAIVQATVIGLQATCRLGYLYAKAGVMLLDLQADSVLQGERNLGYGEASEELAEQSSLMTALDAINHRFRKGTMKIASAGLDGKRGGCSP